MRGDDRRPLVAVLLGICTTASLFGQADAEQLTPGDAALIAEAFHQMSALGSAVWPGLDQIDAPMLYVKDEKEFFIGFPGTPESADASDQRVAGRTVHVRERRYSRSLSASFDVQGASVAALGTPEALEKSPGRWVLTALHEMFHVFQHRRGSTDKIAKLGLAPTGAKDASWQLNYPFPYTNLQVMNLIHLQGYPLFLAATAAPADRSYNLRVALEARDVYRAFLATLGAPDDRLYRYSQFQEWNEGVASYVEYRFAQVAAESAESTAAIVDQFGGIDYAQLWTQSYEQRRFLAKQAGRAARSRTAFYHLGLAKALALDATFPLWKEKYFAADVWLDQLLEEAIVTARSQ